MCINFLLSFPVFTIIVWVWNSTTRNKRHIYLTSHSDPSCLDRADTYVYPIDLRNVKVSLLHILPVFWKLLRNIYISARFRVVWLVVCYISWAWSFPIGKSDGPVLLAHSIITARRPRRIGPSRCMSDCVVCSLVQGFGAFLLVRAFITDSASMRKTTQLVWPCSVPAAASVPLWLRWLFGTAIWVMDDNTSSPVFEWYWFTSIVLSYYNLKR